MGGAIHSTVYASSERKGMDHSLYFSVSLSILPDLKADPMRYSVEPNCSWLLVIIGTAILYVSWEARFDNSDLSPVLHVSPRHINGDCVYMTNFVKHVLCS